MEEVRAPGVEPDPQLLAALVARAREAVVERHPVTRMPKLWTGGFADVYRLRRGSETLAVKCFKRSSTDVRERYGAIAEALEAASLPFFVEFRFLADEMLGPILLSIHNLTYYQRLMAEARAAIEQGRFAPFCDEKLQGFCSAPPGN